MNHRPNHRRSTAAALLLSLVFHGGGAWLLIRYAGAPPPRVERKPIEVEFRVIPREAPTPVKLPEERVTTRSPQKKPAAAQSQPSQPKKASETAQLQVVQPPASSQASSAGKQSADAPKNYGGTALQPRVSTMLPGLGNGEGDDAHGHTVVNGPGEEADPEVVAEYTREKVARKVGDTVNELLGDAARDRGTLPPYFSRVQGEMMDGFGKLAPELSDKTKREKTQDVVDTWLLPASNYGRTGSPFANPEDERSVTETGLGRMADRGGFNPGDPSEAGRMNQTMQALGSMQVMVNSAQRARLKTVLEVRQTSSGALAETVILQKSGDEKFDEFVIHQTRKMLLAVGDTEDGDTPWHDESSNGFRSVWQFTWEPPKVKVKLIRVMRTPAKTPQAE